MTEMALKTPQQYIDSIREIKQRVFIAGKRIEDVTENPNTRNVINSVAKTYELALDPRYQEITTATSHLTGEKISRWTHVPRSIDDLEKRRQMNILMAQKIGTCHARCAGAEGIQVLASVTYAMDQKLGTEYNKRFNNLLRHIQENDLTCSEPQTDAKGDRSKRPQEQEDPDVYLHLVEKRADGIIVRGAKLHQEANFASHYHLVCPPLVPLQKGEEDYALSFAIPVGAEGMTYICQDSAMEAERREVEDIHTLGNPIYGSSVSSMTIFDNVFVPWENVFMCGEIEFCQDYLDKSSRLHNLVCRGACKVGFMDLLIGATQTIAEYNGISRASHVVDKITEMVRVRETTHACSTAAVLNGAEDPPGSGVYFPDFMPSVMAALNTQYGMPQAALLAADIAGGAVVTMPSELELNNPETSQYVKKYLKGVASVPTENRMRMLKFLQHWTAGPQGVRMWHGGGPVQVHRHLVYREARVDMEEKKKLAKDLAGIED
jgi:4-hydroxybutyryl-CoA dehydratase/vinylacetyl-CoA-Delta-isomerase